MQIIQDNLKLYDEIIHTKLGDLTQIINWYTVKNHKITFEFEELNLILMRICHHRS